MRIERGTTRIVFVFKKIVIKVPNIQEYRLFLYGLLANKQEKTFSKIGRIDLAKVYYCSWTGLLLIMERVRAIEDKDIKSEEFYDMLQEKYKEDDMKKFMLSDLKKSNWGYRDNILVKLDYGD